MKLQHKTKLADLLEEFQLGNIWQQLHPKEEDFMYYMARNRVYTRIISFFLLINSVIFSDTHG